MHKLEQEISAHPKRNITKDWRSDTKGQIGSC